MYAHDIEYGRHFIKERSADLAQRVLQSLFNQYQVIFAIRLWNGRLLKNDGSTPMFTLSVDHPSDLRQLAKIQDPIALTKAYFDGDVEVTGELTSAMDAFRIR